MEGEDLKLVTAILMIMMMMMEKSKIWRRERLH
jgi:ABC-type uncharacterized transport system permease subunit